MPSPKEELVAALRQRRALISDETSRSQPEQHVARLQAVSEKITALQEQLPSPVDPQLVHYLARCSYDKALALLEGV